MLAAASHLLDGRPISMILLAEPLRVLDGKEIPIIELIPPVHQRVYKMGKGDSVTGFQQLEYFNRVLEMEIKRARRYGYPLSVCLMRQVDP